MKNLKIVLLATGFLTIAPMVTAQTKSPAPAKKGSMEPTPEQREKMAAVHEKMVTCLRSSKPMSECRQEMMKSCEETMGKEGCPMMGPHKMMHGRE